MHNIKAKIPNIRVTSKFLTSRLKFQIVGEDEGHLCLRLGYSLIDKYVTFKDEHA